ncbi:MAG: efflux RND transporter periplasmic adaptor subunit [Planctomycetota bacterium]|jgi:RND family efflux transporter MFP subunit
MARKRKVILSVITQMVVVAVVLAAAITVYTLLVRTRPLPAKTGAPPAPRRVEVMQARAVPVRRQWQGFGTAAARDKADIPAEVTAVVVEIPPRIVVGAEVEQGEVLCRLDDTDFVAQQEISSQRITDIEAQLAQLVFEESSWERRVELAQEDVKLAEADYERVKQALAKQAARQREVDQVQQRLLAAVRVEVAAREQLDRISPRRSQLQAQKAEQGAALRQANKNVERCTIRSPLTGIIASGDIEVGESVAPGQRIGYVVSLAHVEVPLRLPASARSTVTVGDEVILGSEDPAEQTWLGEVTRTSPGDDASTRTMAVYVELEQDPDDPRRLAPGRFVLGTVISRQAELRYVVPRRSLLGDRLLVIEDGVVRSRSVHVDFHVQGQFEQLGVVAEQWAVLAEPLSEGSQVVVNAARSLPEGLRVEPIALNGRGEILSELTDQVPRGAGR